VEERKMKWTLEDIETKVLELKEMADELGVHKRDIEQLATDLYKIEMKANAIREGIKTISMLA
jgi:hypothetical protein